ncbi:MAG: calcium/sodium antiporter [Alphaproteobacteria bacterium]|nr:calcium/sodium antiporter [Alphaproteobacteria bacterium]
MISVYALLILGFVLLIYGGNLLVDNSVAIAKKIGLSTLFIGLVLVGFGTSTPEMVTSLASVLQSSNGIAVGNVIGSNTANILLVLGVAAVIHPINVDIHSFKRDGFVLGLSTIMLICVMLYGTMNRIIGFIFALTLVLYVGYSFYTDKKNSKNTPSSEMTDTSSIKNIWFALIKAIIGIGLTCGGAYLLVENAKILALHWGISEAIIGLTIVAVGTSLPELAASIIASYKKENGVAFGNVVGSNIYNALFILGTVALVLPIQMPEEMMKNTLIMALVTSVLCLTVLTVKKVSRLMGFLFLCAYVVYIGYLF